MPFSQGNPFFALEFIGSLVDRSLLYFNPLEQRWVWDTDSIDNVDMTDNCLVLLTEKMTLLVPHLQSTLKVASCFGIMIHTSVVECLGSSSQFSNVKECLDELVKEAFVLQNEEGYRFVHDAVREAAYTLISDDEREEVC